MTASTPYNDDTLENAGGYYRYTFPSKDGFWTLKINASDGKNSGYSERMFLISRKSVITSILEYWYIIAMPFVLVSVILFFVKMPDILLVRLRKRESKLKGLLIETQEKYFSEKTINPKNFKDIETKYKSQYESVKADIAELENKDRRLRGYLYRKIHERAKNKESAPVAEENVRNKGKADEENNKNKKEKKPASDSNEKKGWEDEALSGKEK